MKKYEIVTPRCRYDVEADLFLHLSTAQSVVYFYRSNNKAKELVGIANLSSIISIHLAELSPDDEEEDQPKEAQEETFGLLG